MKGIAQAVSSWYEAIAVVHLMHVSSSCMELSWDPFIEAIANVLRDV
jgi:hypothetical protein